MSNVPSYPRDASEREAAVPPETSAHDLASWGSRVGAYLLDSVILIVPPLVLIGLVFASDPRDGSAAWSLVVVAYLAVLVLPFVYFSVLHGGERGQTYGKRALGIRVVDGDGGRLGHGRAFGRYAIVFVFGLFFVPLLLDYLWPLWDTKNQSLHDKVVGSLVVRA